MTDVSEWLQALGLGKYAKTFEENEIDFAALPHLTEKMLEQLGLPIGPRAKLLAAISEPALSAAPRLPGRPSEVAGERGERRQVTVMFCDLVDSTRLASSLDPEDFGPVIQAYQRACATVVERYQGHISQFRGDGIEVIFGWPAAQEDASERAVRAGLDVVQAVKDMVSPQPMSVRVGISTGIVVTGLDDPSSPSGAVGEALHMAARLQGIAAPNTVVLSETTSRLVSARFEQDELGLQELKGLAAPVRVFRVSRVRDDTTRFQAAHESAMTPLVGRATELAFLRQRWTESCQGEGQAVFISGVPGVGKSRIVHELGKAIEHERHWSLTFQCLPHCMQSALYPVIQSIERLAHLSTDDTEAVKIGKLEKLVSRATRRIERVMPFVTEMMSLESAGRYLPLQMTAQQTKTQTLHVLVDLLIELSVKRPVLCVLEDAQWIDPSTQELLELLVSRVESGRILLIATQRPDYQVPPAIESNVSTLTITRLGRRDIAEMARLALGSAAVNTAVMKRIIDESDSIPLFLEELTRAAIEAGSERQQYLFDEAPDGQPTLVPESLRDALLSRLDRSPQGRTVAQMAAVIGREFSYDMLHRVTALSSSELDMTLAHLRQSDIVQLVDSRPPARYAFKHALLRDAAYESMLRSRRREIHAQIASLLEKEWPEVAAGQPELLAYHYSLAGQAEWAVRHWVLGGRRARSRSAPVEAIVQFQKALQCLDALPETPERIATELEIHLSLGLCFITVHGYSADDTRTAFERAYALSTGTTEPNKEIQSVFGLWGHYWMRARHDRALELAETLLARAGQLGDPTFQGLGHRCKGSTLFTFGDFIRAREHLEQAVALAKTSRADTSLLAFAVDPGLAAQLVLAWDLWILGYPDQARERALRSLGEAADRDDPYTLAFAHYVMSAVHLLRGEFEDALKNADQSFALSQEHRISLYALYSRFGRGCALLKMGQADRALNEICEGIEEAKRSKLGYMRGFMLGWLAAAQAAREEPETALSTIEGALREVDEVTGRAWEAELRRLRGDILLTLRPDDSSEAEAAYAQAIAVAGEQGARSLQLRAATSMAQLLKRLERHDEARQVLATVLGGFGEGFGTADLRDARAMLDRLAQT